MVGTYPPPSPPPTPPPSPPPPPPSPPPAPPPAPPPSPPPAPPPPPPRDKLPVQRSFLRDGHRPEHRHGRGGPSRHRAGRAGAGSPGQRARGGGGRGPARAQRHDDLRGLRAVSATSETQQDSVASALGNDTAYADVTEQPATTLCPEGTSTPTAEQCGAHAVAVGLPFRVVTASTSPGAPSTTTSASTARSSLRKCCTRRRPSAAVGPGVRLQQRLRARVPVPADNSAVPPRPPPGPPRASPSPAPPPYPPAAPESPRPPPALAPPPSPPSPPRPPLPPLPPLLPPSHGCYGDHAGGPRLRGQRVRGRVPGGRVRRLRVGGRLPAGAPVPAHHARLPHGFFAVHVRGRRPEQRAGHRVPRAQAGPRHGQVPHVVHHRPRRRGRVRHDPVERHQRALLPGAAAAPRRGPSSTRTRPRTRRTTRASAPSPSRTTLRSATRPRSRCTAAPTNTF